jgi:outer membrane lipoprotein SlyB
MKRLVIIFVIFSFLSLQLAGCVTTTGAGRGAAVGAVAGGVLGAILGDTRGAIIGAFAGAIVGAVIGNYYDKQIASRAEAAKKYEYKGKEEKIEIEDSSIMPQNVAAGSTVEASVQYVVLVPVETQQIKITETRTLVNGKDSFEIARREVVRTQGSHLSTVRFIMPKDIAKGDHTLVTTISDGRQTRTTKDALRIM